MPPAATSIALFRAINVGGRNMIAMAALRDLLASLGYADIRTLLHSGNAVFRHGPKAAARIECDLEAAIGKTFGLAIDCFARPPAEWDDAVAHNPFATEARTDPGRLILMTLKSAPDGEALARLRAAIEGPERVALWQRVAYIHYPDGAGQSKLTPKLIEDRLGTRGTGRNWNTMCKLRELAASL
jgi:uncharacterized protein (DUF1697 family)